jgi:hypothetical protein
MDRRLSEKVKSINSRLDPYPTWEFRRRVKTQGSLPSAQAAELLLFGLIISGQIRMRRIDGWRELKHVALPKAA